MTGVGKMQIERAKQVDLLALIGNDTKLKRTASTRGGEYAGPCPFCGGEDRLHVQPKRGIWWCRQCNHRYDTPIGYIMRRDQVDFPKAVQVLVGGTDRMGKAFSFLCSNGGLGGVAPQDVIQSPPATRWQELMSQYVSGCVEALQSSVGIQGLDWLHQRGLTDTTVSRANLGYDVQERAIVIPIVVQDILWAIKIRHLYGQPKYRYARGSCAAIPYPVAWLTGKPSLLLCEGEFDALLLVQEAGDLIDVLTFGSATARLSSQWFSQLQSYTQIAVVMDGDPAGELAVAYWLSMFPQAVRLMSPAKDITLAYCAGLDLHGWVSESLKMLVQV